MLPKGLNENSLSLIYCIMQGWGCDASMVKLKQSKGSFVVFAFLFALKLASLQWENSNFLFFAHLLAHTRA